MENELMRKAAQKTGLQLIKIKTKDELEDLLRSGLNTLYADVFGGEPYNEVFSEEEIDNIFMDYFDKNGEIFVGICPQTQKPVSFVASTPLKYKFDIVSLLGPQIDTKNSAYFAEDGVAEQFRRQGISSAMKELLLSYCFSLGYANVILRTSLENTPQRRAVEKANGVLLGGKTQDVERTQKDGPVLEQNCFYLFKPQIKG
tara:strand:+ start:36 stop:638 length:603 start_codon:yes stop_codon:yes gene_type:complete